MIIKAATFSFHQQINTAHNHQQTANTFDPDDSIALVAPIEVGLHLVRQRAEKDNDAAMADGKGEDEQHGADKVALRPTESNAEDRGNIGECAGTKRHTECESQQQRCQ